MNHNTSLGTSYYQAPTQLADGLLGTWYAEYDGLWTVREFVICPDGRTAVAPFDFALRKPDHVVPPPLSDIVSITFPDFESLWEQFAQARLHELVTAHADRGEDTADAAIRYFRIPFPAELKRNEAASVIYVEFAQGVARRSFEVFPDCALAAPFDVCIPVGDTDEMLRAAREGIGPDGEIVDPRVRPEEISHAAFEADWELHALPRLHALAELKA